jgi:uncharacterized protein
MERGRMLPRRRLSILTIAAAIALPVMLITPGARSEPAALTNTEVSFRSGAVTIHGTVVATPSNATKRPGMVLVHGSGTGLSRDKLRPEAEAFARSGIVTLIYDKNPVGYSDFVRDFSSLADDALAAVRMLRTRPEVDPARVGLWGFSEGGWVVPLAASRSTDVSFLVLVGANGVTPARAQAWSYGEWLRRQGVSGSALDTVQTTVMRVIRGAGLYAEADYDPVPVLERVRQPVLGIWGGHDKQTPPEEGARIMRDSLDRGGNTHYTIRVFPNAQHAQRNTTDGFDKLDGYTPGYFDLVGSWVNGLAAGAPTASSDPLPHQDQQAVALSPLAWYESVWVQVIALVLLIGLFAGYPITALVRRIRGHRDTPPGARPARWLAATGPLAVLGLVFFVLLIAASGGQNVGPVVVGRPLVWLVVQLLALGAVVAGVATALSWRRHPEARVRRGLLLAAGAIFLPWALYWGLLIP